MAKDGALPRFFHVLTQKEEVMSHFFSFCNFKVIETFTAKYNENLVKEVKNYLNSLSMTLKQHKN